MIGVSEAINLGIRLGLEPEMIARVINTSTGRCWSSDTYNPCPGIIEGIPSSNNYQGGFASQLMVKVSKDKPLGLNLCQLDLNKFAKNFTWEILKSEQYPKRMYCTKA